MYKGIFDFKRGLKIVDKKSVEIFDNALYGVCERLRKVLVFLPDSVKAQVQEIRLRCGKSVALTVGGETLFVSPASLLLPTAAGAVKADKKDLEESFRLLCFRSVYSHLSEIKNGYIMMRGGHRAGVCGTFLGEGGIAFVSSLNIRLARQLFGAADFLLPAVCGGVLIAGPPGSGKTTVLRDLIRQLSVGKTGKPCRVAAVDTRGEISASFEGVSYNDLGENTDILLGVEKKAGIEIAIRTLYPHYVAFDEIGSLAELHSISECLCAGVDIITTAHIKDKNDLMKREITKRLLLSGAVQTVAVLSSPAGSGAELLKACEVIKNCGC